MHQFPMGQSKFINIEFTDVEIGNSGKMKMGKALLDTGNTCISIPNRFEDQILKGFKTKNNHCAFEVEKHVPMFSLLICRVGNLDELPTIVMNIGGD